MQAAQTAASAAGRCLLRTWLRRNSTSEQLQVAAVSIRTYSSKPVGLPDVVAGTDAEVRSMPAGPGPSSTALAANRLDRDRMLIRDFIHNSLYHPTRGYFNRPVPVVGHVDTPINYWKIYNAMEWRSVVSKKYKELQVSFLTPAELFTPWYGQILARHIFEHRKHNLGQEGMPLTIYEIGGGNGTLARDVLDWIRENRPADYERTTYTCIEISTRLAAQQYETVVTQGGHGNHFRMSRGNAWDRASWGERNWDHTFILMMEVLDNLPHDRVCRRNAKSEWQQTVVARAPGGTWEDGPWLEQLEPLQDPLLQRAVDAVYVPPTFDQQLDAKFNRILDFILEKDVPTSVDGEVMFVPTACLEFMDVLHDARPNHSLIAADFDHLPDVRVPGANAPLVAEKVGGENIDHDTIYVPWGRADIFFPTDFAAMGRMYTEAAEHIWGQGNGQVATSHYRQGAVMKRYKEMFKTATICAFNPMVDDFLNARFFFGDAFNRRDPSLAVSPAVAAARQAALSAQQSDAAAGGISVSHDALGDRAASNSEQQQAQPAQPQQQQAPPAAAAQQQQQTQKASRQQQGSSKLPPQFMHRAPQKQGSQSSGGSSKNVLRPGAAPPPLPSWMQKKMQQQQQQGQQQPQADSGDSEERQPSEPVLGGQGARKKSGAA